MDSSEVLRCLVDVSSSGSIRLTGESRRVLGHFRKCRTAANGCRILKCDPCNLTMVVYNPCNKRGCPKCAKKLQMVWLEKVKNRILATGHSHLVFSLPGVYARDWMTNPRKLIRKFFKAVAAIMKDLEKSTGLQLGWILVFQSHGRGMSFKPHIHCLLTGGGLDANDQWHPLGDLPLEQMAQSLEQHITEGGDGHGQSQGWSVYQTRHENSGEAIVGYLAKTMAGLVVSESEMERKDELVVFEDRHEGVVRRTKLRETTFVERYLRHIPPAKTVMVRYFGLYSNRHRDKLKIAREFLGHSKDLHPSLDKVLFIEPCPCCHGPMHAILATHSGYKVRYENYGFIHGPPAHREYRKVS